LLDWHIICALKNDTFLFNQNSVSYLLASQMSSDFYLINKKLSYITTEIVRVGSHSLSFKVIDFATNRKPVCDLLLVNNTILHPILHRFRVTTQ